ncbi:Ger(x)C family spore germination protein [Paenibacillus wynnii]|uniref:Ger(x)C family spore germination protein n=1 Tax=Paenibacillus wynnii TaxID=268407 RepID=UPI0027922CCD|nr:Ger(x)C family spore germination protein [Paenibacillus wynnii]MDQ0194481.1 spore germination protein KC [Paenibacillus wynnii]
MRVKWILRSVIYFVMLSLLTSCWNSRELGELGIVSGFGIDKGPNKDEYRVTFQVVNPSATATSTGASKNHPPVTIYSSTDTTVFGALRKTSKKAARQLFFAHTQLVVIGESLARSGINDIFDVFERSHELRLNSLVLVSRDADAASILKVILPIESLPAMGIVKKNKNTAGVWGENRDVNIFELINGITGESDFVISGVRINGDEQEGMKLSNLDQTEVKALVVMSGLGVFKDGKLVDWMDGPKARGTVWVQDKIKETSINIDYKNKKKSVSVDINLSKTKVKVKIREGIPVFDIHIKEKGIVNETKSFVDLSKGDEILKLEVSLAEQTKKEVTQAVETAQRMQTDIFNFANELKRTNPKAWKSVEKDWPALFAKGKLNVHIDAYIRSTGMRLKPYLKENSK